MIRKTLLYAAAVMRLAVLTSVILVMAFSCAKNESPDIELPTAEIRDYKGLPTIYINGEPNAGMTYMTYNPLEKQYRQFGEISVDLASFQTSANKNLYWDDPPVWVSRDSFDFSLLDEEMEMIVRANPNVWIFPRIYLWSPAWWDKENPDELMMFDDGSTEKPLRHITDPNRKTSHPSWASEKWRKDTAYCLKKMIAHIRSQPYGKRVIGYHIASGGTEEWFYWSAPPYNTKFYVDYSRPQTEAFRRWLKDKYKTQEDLQKAWNDNNVTFETVTVPSGESRGNTDLMFFRDPAASRNVMDYYLFHSYLDANTIDYFGKVVKEETDYKQLYGAFYGYTLARYSCTDGGHLALMELLKSPYVDFLTSPTEYAYRNVGDGYSDLRTEIKSIQLHGKVWFDENDYRTYLCQPTGWGWTDNFNDSKAHQIRQMASIIARSSPAWWFDMGGGWYDSPEFMEAIGKLNRIAERSIHVDRRSAAEIVMVVDEHSLAIAEADSNFTRQLLAAQRYQIGHMGAPVDYLLTDDLAIAPDYKMYIFVSQFHVTPEQKKEIKRLKERGAKAIVWVYAPGFVSEDRLDVNGIKDLTGISVSYEKEKAISRVDITGSPTLPDARPGLSYGATERPTGPVFFADDKEAELLGIIKPLGKPGLVVKEIDGVQVYYSAAPAIAAPVLRGIARKAGVNIYIDRYDDIYVNRSFLGIHTDRPGPRQITLPKKTDVYDVYLERPVASQVSEFSVQIDGRSSVLYFLGSESEWNKTRDMK